MTWRSATNRQAPEQRIEINEFALSLPSLPGIDPKALAAEIERALAAAEIAPPTSDGKIASVTLPTLTRLPGESAERLAKRIAGSVVQAIVSRGGEAAR